MVPNGGLVTPGPRVSVIGAGQASPEESALARELGDALGRAAGVSGEIREHHYLGLFLESSRILMHPPALVRKKCAGEPLVSPTRSPRPRALGSLRR